MKRILLILILIVFGCTNEPSVDNEIDIEATVQARILEEKNIEATVESKETQNQIIEEKEKIVQKNIIIERKIIVTATPDNPESFFSEEDISMNQLEIEKLYDNVKNYIIQLDLNDISPDDGIIWNGWKPTDSYEKTLELAVSNFNSIKGERNKS